MKKQCTRCKKEKPFSDFGKEKKVKSGLKSWCKECLRKYNRDVMRERYKKNPQFFLDKNRDWKTKNPERHKAINKRRVIKLRTEILQHYGGKIPKCACCGETTYEFLAIDHINGLGKQHRNNLGVRGGGGFYTWLKKNNFPKGFQVLCHNCNCAKGFYGECPHKRK